MFKKMVVAPDQMPGMFERLGKAMAEICKQVLRGLREPGKGLSLDQLQLFIEHRNPFTKTTTLIVDAYESIRRDWEKFYKDDFNLKVDFSGVRFPKCLSGWRFIIVAQGISSERVFQLSKQIFGKAWKYYDRSLDEVIVKNERSNKDGAYVICVRDGQEADEIHKNKSANQVEVEKLLTETTLERLIHGLKYFRETRKQLDVETITLCSGSRCDDGSVPVVGWSSIGGELSVHWCSPGFADGNLRAREVVS
jgi:hypothetical protein